MSRELPELVVDVANRDPVAIPHDLHHRHLERPQYFGQTSSPTRRHRNSLRDRFAPRCYATTDVSVAGRNVPPTRRSLVRSADMSRPVAFRLGVGEGETSDSADHGRGTLIFLLTLVATAIWIGGSDPSGEFDADGRRRPLRADHDHRRTQPPSASRPRSATTPSG